MEEIRARIRLHQAIASAHARYAAELAELIGEDIAPPLGAIQQRVVDLPMLTGEDGATAREVADAIGYDQANTHTVLKSLERHGHIVSLPVRPRRWKRASDGLG